MRNPKITIIDYGAGNVYSVFNAISSLGYKNIIVSDSKLNIKNSDAIVLPGVGAFDSCINNLKEKNLDSILYEEVMIKSKPILGICVGMQLFATQGEENGINKGLNWIPGTVKKIKIKKEFPIPHVGWNNISIINNKLFINNNINSDFYFDHSYYFDCEKKYISAYCDYGNKLTAAVNYKNIFGVQFHPEKSQKNGLKLFRQFFNLI